MEDFEMDEQTDQQESGEEKKDETELFPIKGYIILNLIFYVFCFFQVLIVHKAGGESEGLFFFFLTIALGFTVVSIFDCLYDRYKYRKNQAGDES